MRVNLKIQWGYTFFLTWHCKTNYFKYKLCLVYNYMERYLFKLLWSMRNPTECLCCVPFFFLSWECCSEGGTAKNPGPDGVRRWEPVELRPLNVMTCHLFCSTTVQPCVFLLSLHVLRCLYFIWPNNVVMGCLYDLTSLQTCGTLF